MSTLSPARRWVVRVGLGILAVSQAMIGAWALFAPENFFTSFPAAGHAWVAVLPPYNEHLTRDVGALSLALTVVLVAAVLRPDPWWARVAAISFAVYAVPHTAFHALHLEHMSTADAISQTVGFLLQLVVIGVVIMASLGVPDATRRREPVDDRTPATR